MSIRFLESKLLCNDAKRSTSNLNLNCANPLLVQTRTIMKRQRLPTPVRSHDSNTHQSYFLFNSGPNDSCHHLGCRYVFFGSFLASYLASKCLLMTDVTAKRVSVTHPHTTPLLSKRDVRPFVLGRRCFRGGRGESEDAWKAGENPTVHINEYRHTNPIKPLSKSTMVKMNTRTRRGTAPTPHNDDDGTTQRPH